MQTLALSKNISTAVQPKPTKAEVIEAMTRLKIEQITKDQQALVIQRKALVEKANAMLKAFLLKNAGKMNLRFDFGYNQRSFVKDRWEYTGKVKGVLGIYDLSPLPDELHKFLTRIHELPNCVTLPEEKKIRQQIRDAAEGIKGDRVFALVSSPECRAGLEKMMKEIGV